MVKALFEAVFESIRDGFRHRFGPQPVGDEYEPTEQERRESLGRHNDSEARIVAGTLADPNDLRAYGKGRPY